jgi:hypothetical protein
MKLQFRVSFFKGDSLVHQITGEPFDTKIENTDDLKGRVEMITRHFERLTKLRIVIEQELKDE